MKKVAFIVSVYKKDRLDFFIEAINSIKNQDYGFENINIYLGIDGELSNDVKQYIVKNQSCFYKIVHNKQNKGLAHILNRLIDVLEDEEYIFRMDSDDICMTNRVSKQMDVFCSDAKLLVVGTNIIEIDEYGNNLRKKIMPLDYEAIKKYSISRSPLNHPTVAIKKDFFNIVGKYNESFLKAQDYELWSRALKKNVKIININESLLYFRVSSDYMNKRNSMANYLNEFKISIGLMNYFMMYSEFPKILAKFIVRISPSLVGRIVYKKIRNSI